MPYVYKITNNINGKIYIGKTSQTVERRFAEHCHDRTRYPKRPLYAAMNKYGVECFSVEVVEFCPNDEITSDREVYWINYYQSYSKGYNATFGGDGKRVYDYNLIYQEWLKSRNCAETAKVLGVDPETVANAVREHGEQPYCKKGFINQQQGVDRLTLDGQYIDSFSSIREALRLILPQLNKNLDNISGYASHIGQVCKGTRKTCLGYKWRYSETQND